MWFPRSAAPLHAHHVYQEAAAVGERPGNGSDEARRPEQETRLAETNEVARDLYSVGLQTASLGMARCSRCDVVTSVTDGAVGRST